MTNNLVLKLKTSKFDGLKNLFKNYLKHNSLTGCTYYVTPGICARERYFWLAVHAFCLTSVFVMVLSITLKYADTPTVTSPETKNYPISNVTFPGVAICYVNKINYSAAMELAEDIMEYNYAGNFTIEEITDMLKYLGHLYLFELNNSEKYKVNLLHNLLIRRYRRYVPYTLKMLAPDISCQRMLQHCSWGGKEQICDDIFYARITGDGFCCTFNYVRKSDTFEGSKKSNVETWNFVKAEHPQTIGSQFGLTLLIQPDLTDHHYKILPTLGHKILIFPSLDFPDTSSGGLREIIISPRTVSLLTLDAVPFYSVPAVSKFDVEDRNCLFNNELALIFGGYYSYSDCIMHCRIADIRKLCKCIPFFYPKDHEPIRFCDLRDLPCLKRYRTKWMRIKPKIKENVKSFPCHEVNGELDCSECFPACTDIMYKVSVSSFKMSAPTVRMGTNIYNFDNRQSIVHIFFQRPGTIRLKQDVLYYWYDLMSNYGGICGLFLGVSVISIAELLYFFTLRLFYKREDETKERDISHLTYVKAVKSKLPPLYWTEMAQGNGKY